MKRNIAVATLTAAVLVGGGLVTTAAFADSDDAAKGAKDDRTASADRSAGDGAAAGKPATAGRAGLDEAVAAALKAAPGTVTEAERDDEDGRAVWELDVYGSDRVRHEVTVDAADGKVLSDRKDDTTDEGDDHEGRAARSAAVSLDAAVRAALDARPGTVTSVDLDDDHEDDGRAGRTPHWEVEVTGGNGERHELHVDARTGKVTADRAESDD
ncbi:PepSY domain-containing protein [Streptomyces sp. NPDC006296]|uniref:PepSY domain-containing protein n=1 Tax=Streptomyces sp. NPDC006296 TaxID=3156746 RepID=UPI0033B90CC1